MLALPVKPTPGEVNEARRDRGCIFKLDVAKNKSITAKLKYFSIKINCSLQN